MEKVLEEISVHTMNPLHRRGPVFYASLPCTTMNKEETKRHLVSVLWDRLATIGSPLWTFPDSSNRTAFPIHLARDPLGKPALLLGAHQGPAISFSECGGKVWAALCWDESDVGIDATEAVEFQGKYPFQSVFHAQEIQHVLRLAGGELREAAALIWSAKEAVVKALGCAFHFVDPLEIHVHPPIEEDSGYTFPVFLSGKALARFPIAEQALWVHSVSQGKMWLSIAVLQRLPVEGSCSTS